MAPVSVEEEEEEEEEEGVEEVEDDEGEVDEMGVEDEVGPSGCAAAAVDRCRIGKRTCPCRGVPGTSDAGAKCSVSRACENAVTIRTNQHLRTPN